jgi:hypothetical protein
MNELAKAIIEDGQSVRAVHNYLSETFDGIKQKEIFDNKFTDRIEFAKFVQGVCSVMIESFEAWKESEPEEYLEANQA